MQAIQKKRKQCKQSPLYHNTTVCCKFTHQQCNKVRRPCCIASNSNANTASWYCRTNAKHGIATVFDCFHLRACKWKQSNSKQGHAQKTNKYVQNSNAKQLKTVQMSSENLQMTETAWSQLTGREWEGKITETKCIWNFVWRKLVKSPPVDHHMIKTRWLWSQGGWCPVWIDISGCSVDNAPTSTESESSSSLFNWQDWTGQCCSSWRHNNWMDWNGYCGELNWLLN